MIAALGGGAVCSAAEQRRLDGSRARRGNKSRGHSRETSDVLQGRRSDLPGEMPGVPSAELDRADVAHHLPGSPALGSLDQGARRDAPDAAVAHRPERRRTAFQERHVADRPAGRHHRPLGRRRGAQGDPKEMPPAKPLVTDNGWEGESDGFGPPDLVVRSSRYTIPAKHQDVWYRPTSDLPRSSRAGRRWSRFVRPT